jgi:hypothetical protein
MEDEEQCFLTYIIKFAVIVFLIICGFVWAGVSIHKHYNVWAEGKLGEAELARAESNRRIKTLEAKAFLESANYMADAEIVRAQGVAEANKIIGDSLKDNESYLRYLWIQSLNSQSSQVVYVPTEANLPILEASRLK